MARKTQMLIATLAVFAILAQFGCGGTGGSNNNKVLPPAGTEFLYSGNVIGDIRGFTVDPNSGVLAPLANAPFPVTNLAAADIVRLALDPSGTAVYATSKGLGGPNVAALSIDRSSGALNVVSSQTLTITPGQIAVDPAGKNAYVIADPENSAAQLFVFSIAPSTHALALLPNQPTALPGVPSDVAVDPSGGFVYVTVTGAPGRQIAGFGRDASTGALTPLAGSPFANTGGDGAYAIRVTPNGQFVIVTNLKTSNLSVLSLNRSTGALRDVAGSPFASAKLPGAVAIDPSGNIVSVTDDAGFSTYTIGASGALALVGETSVIGGTTPQPGTAVIDPTGKFVFACSGGREISGFSLASTGALTPVAGSPFFAGTPMRSVIVVKP